LGTWIYGVVGDMKEEGVVWGTVGLFSFFRRGLFWLTSPASKRGMRVWVSSRVLVAVAGGRTILGTVVETINGAGGQAIDGVSFHINNEAGEDLGREGRGRDGREVQVQVQVQV
jgi:hypothetical protein